MNFYLSLVFFQGFQAFFLPISEEFHWDRSTTSGAFSLRQLESGIVVPVLGFTVDRLGPRTVILCSVLVTGAGMVLMSFITNLWMFYGAFMVISLGASGASHGISWPVAIVAWFKRLRGLALGLACM
jgi:MFS family permease